MKLSSVFLYVFLFLALMSLSCSESKNAQLDRKYLELGVQTAEKIATKECSEKNLSVADCSRLRADMLEKWRKMMQENIDSLDKSCKESFLVLEDECVKVKQELLQKTFYALRDL
jgi:hypothetical protein